MKPIVIFLVLGFLAYCSYGQEAKNVISRSDQVDCVASNPSEDSEVHGASDCVDRNLYDSTTGKYYDKCCYMRVMVNGNIGEGCYGLSRERTVDVPGNIPQLEDKIKQRLSQNSNLAAQYGLEMTEGKEVKIYSLDCDASYIKYFASVLALFCLLF